MKWRPFIWLGMAFSVLVVGIGLYFTWNYLCNREARLYGTIVTNRLRDTVSKIDQITTTTFTPDYYYHLNHQPLLQIDLDHDSVMQGFSRELYQVVKNPVGGFALFTECGLTENSKCYYDTLFGIPNGSNIVGYNPKSRPWYLLARIHPDWVFFTFLGTKQSVPGYPKTPALGFAKHIVRGTPTSGDDGLWLVVFSPNAAKTATADGTSPSSLIAMLFNDEKSSLDSLDVSLPSYLLFSDALLKGTVPLTVHCAAITDVAGLHYQASVQCTVNGEGIHYTFSKPYDHPFYLWVLLIIATVILYGAFRFWHYVAALQLQQVEGELAVEVESKLVHDLRKGILSQLNKIFDDPAPDLQRHRHYLTLLNKYVGLLSNSLRRKKETQWVPLTEELVRQYLGWIIGDVPVAKDRIAEGGPFLELHYNMTMTMHCNSEWPKCDVPEMGFYRILKNLIENYNTHGVGGLTISLSDLGATIRLCARNGLPKEGVPSIPSTHLGLVIVRQLLEDNFGPKARIRSELSTQIYQTEIDFPKVSHD